MVVFEAIDHRQPGVSRSIGRIDTNGALELLARTIKNLATFGRPRHDLAPLQETIVGLDTARAAIIVQPRFFRRGERHLEGIDDLPGDLVLHLEDVGEVAVEALRPEMRAGRRVDELGIDADTVAGSKWRLRSSS